MSDTYCTWEIFECACVALVVSVVTVSIGIEIALCSAINFGKSQHSRKVYVFYGNRYIKCVSSLALL